MRAWSPGSRGLDRPGASPVASGDAGTTLSRRLPLGHRHRRAPGRGRQLEQRLVGVGARPRARRAASRPATRATTTTATPRTSRSSPTSASTPTASRSSGAASSPRTASSRAPRSTTTGAMCGALPRARPRAGRHLPPLHDAALGRGARRLDRAGDGRPLRALLRARGRAPRRPRSAAPARSTSRTSSPLMGYLVGIFPPGERDAGLRERANEVFVAAHRTARRRHQGRARRRPRRPDALDGGLAGGRTAARRRATRERRDMEDVFLEAARGDDFIGVQTYTRIRVGPDGMLRPRAGARTHRRWATSSGPRRSRRRSAAPGR